MILYVYVNKNAKGAYLWTKNGYEKYFEQYKNRIEISRLLEIEPFVLFAKRKYFK